MIGPWHTRAVWVPALPFCIKLKITADMSSKLQSDLNQAASWECEASCPRGSSAISSEVSLLSHSLALAAEALSPRLSERIGSQPGSLSHQDNNQAHHLAGNPGQRMDVSPFSFWLLLCSCFSSGTSMGVQRERERVFRLIWTLVFSYLMRPIKDRFSSLTKPLLSFFKVYGAISLS